MQQGLFNGAPVEEFPHISASVPAAVVAAPGTGQAASTFAEMKSENTILRFNFKVYEYYLSIVEDLNWWAGKAFEEISQI